MDCLLCKENQDGIWIKKYKYWNVHACWFQHTLGTIGVILNRHAEKFVELTKEEIEELGEIIKVFQKALDSEFSPDWYNIQQNGNWHHHFHFLIFPRYKEERVFEGKKYVDKAFGEPIIYTREKEDESIRIAMTGLLAKKI